MSFYGAGQEFALLEDAVEAAGMAWWLMELPSKQVFFSPNKIVMLGYTKREMDKFRRYTDFTDLIHPDDYEPAMQAMRDHLEGRAPMYETQYRIRSKSGDYITYYDRGKIVGKNAKGEIAVAGMLINITTSAPRPLAI